MGTLRYNNNSKFNKGKPIIGYCVHCLEKAIFRSTYDKVDDNISSVTALTCTRCLVTTKYNKKKNKKAHFLFTVYKNKLTTSDKVERFFKRLNKFFFTGTWNRKKFDFRLLSGK